MLLWSSATVAFPFPLLGAQGWLHFKLLPPEHSPASLPEHPRAVGVGVGINLWNSIRKTPLLSAPCTALNWEGTIWAAGKDSPAHCSPRRDNSLLPGCVSSLRGASSFLEGSDEALVIHWEGNIALHT